MVNWTGRAEYSADIGPRLCLVWSSLDGKLAGRTDYSADIGPR